MYLAVDETAGIGDILARLQRELDKVGLQLNKRKSTLHFTQKGSVPRAFAGQSEIEICETSFVMLGAIIQSERDVEGAEVNKLAAQQLAQTTTTLIKMAAAGMPNKVKLDLIRECVLSMPVHFQRTCSEDVSGPVISALQEVVNELVAKELFAISPGEYEDLFSTPSE